MKKGRIVLIACIVLALLLAGAFVLRALLLRRPSEPPMEEDELLSYIAEFKGDESKENDVQDLFWNP